MAGLDPDGRAFGWKRGAQDVGGERRLPQRRKKEGDFLAVMQSWKWRGGGGSGPSESAAGPPRKRRDVVSVRPVSPCPTVLGIRRLVRPVSP